MVINTPEYLHYQTVSTNRIEVPAPGAPQPSANSSEKEWPESWRRIYFKAYPRFPQIELPTPDRSNTPSLDAIIKQRQSVREFSSDSPLPLTTLTRVLDGIAITTRGSEVEWDSRRGYPSAGARYPTEAYIIPLHVEGLERRVHHYNVRHNRLEKLWSVDDMALRSCFPLDTWWESADMLIVLTSFHKRSAVKYGERAYRFCLLEAGHAAQNLSLFSAAAGLGACAYGGFCEEPLMRLLDIHPNDEVPVHTLFLGRERKH